MMLVPSVDARWLDAVMIIIFAGLLYAWFVEDEL